MQEFNFLYKIKKPKIIVISKIVNVWSQKKIMINFFFNDRKVCPIQIPILIILEENIKNEN